MCRICHICVQANSICAHFMGKATVFQFRLYFLELRYIMAWFHKSLSGIRVTEGVF